MNIEKTPMPNRYSIENEVDRIRVIITPFKNYRLFRVMVYLLLLLFIIIFISMLIPLIFVLITPFGTILGDLFAVIITTFLLPVAIIALIIFAFNKTKYIMEVTQRGIIIINQYGLVKKETEYVSENIKYLRLSQNSSWGAISFDYGTSTIDICPSLSGEDANQILFAIGEKYPFYKQEIEAGKLFMRERKISRIQALGVSLLLLCILGGFGTLVAMETDIQKTSTPSLVLIWAITIAISISAYQNSQKRSWVSTLIMQCGLTTLLLAYSIHTIKTYTSGWIWAVPILGAFMLAWIMPILNPRMAKAIHDGQKRFGEKQKTIGTIVFSSILVVGWMIPREAYLFKAGKISIGILLILMAISGAQLLAYQIWNQRKIEKHEGNAS
jgi:hypothetical protein